MLEKIKSKFFLRMLFSTLDERSKLKLVQYNKRLQKEININIVNYKIFSGRYIIYETNEIGAEYNNYNDKIVFEGEYLNGKRNGKGKVYDDFMRMFFEVEYLNGKRCNEKIYNQVNNKINYLKEGKGFIRDYFIKDTFNNFIDNEIEFEEYFFLNGNKWNGKGYNLKGNNINHLNNGNGTVREYDIFGNLIFEGDYTNGIRNGKGKEYNTNNGLIFEGEYINGKRNGKGKIYTQNGELKFEGEYLNNFKIKGKEYINGVLEYEGEYLYDKKWNGKGYDLNGKVIYELNNGNGRVKEYINYERLIFDGEYLNGERWNGRIEDDCFIGKYVNGKKIGKEYDNFGQLIFEGEFFKGKKIGKLFKPAKDYNKNNSMEPKTKIIKDKNSNYVIVFEGELINEKRWNGKVKEYNDDIILIFESEYSNGKINGKAKEYNNYGKLIFEGEYLNGKRNGKGKGYNFGKLEFEGEYLNGKKYNGKGYDRKHNIIYELKNGNGFVKEYSSNGQLIFEGQYLNGERDGDGKEYNHIFGFLLFEGEYLKGKRWNGKGKEYDNTGNLISEEIYINGNINKEEKEKSNDKNKGERKNKKF